MAGGFAFRPDDHELIDLFLRPKIAGLIHDVDVYSAAPDQLVAGRTAAPGSGIGDARVWYFFSPVHHCAGKRKARTVGADGKEWWHSDAGQKTVKVSAALQFFDSHEVDNLSGGEPRAAPPSPAEPCPVGVLPLQVDEEELFKRLEILERDGVQMSSEFDECYLMTFDGVDMSALQSFDDELPRAPPPSPAEPEPKGGVLALQVDEEELFKRLERDVVDFDERYLMSGVDSTSLQSFDFQELDNQLEDGHHHRAEAEDEVNELFKMLERLERDGVQMSSEFDERYLMSFDGVDMSALQSFDDELPRAPPPSPAGPEPEGDAGVGFIQTTTIHGPCPDGLLALQVDKEELELEDELAPGESHPRPRGQAAHLAHPVFSKLSNLYKSVKRMLLR